MQPRPYCTKGSRPKRDEEVLCPVRLLPSLVACTDADDQADNGRDLARNACRTIQEIVGPQKRADGDPAELQILSSVQGLEGAL